MYFFSLSLFLPIPHTLTILDINAKLWEQIQCEILAIVQVSFLVSLSHAHNRSLPLSLLKFVFQICKRLPKEFNLKNVILHLPSRIRTGCTVTPLLFKS